MRQDGCQRPPDVRSHSVQYVPQLYSWPRSNIQPSVRLTARRVTLLNPPPSTAAAVEWQMCAVLGKLHRQGGNAMRFAVAPSKLTVDPWKGSFGKCSGWRDAACNMPWVGFANDDIYYLEVCLLSQICRNRRRLFRITESDEFNCDFDGEAFDTLEGWLLSGPTHG